MSNIFFEKKINIYISKYTPPVLFVHKKDIATPNGYFLHLNNYVEMYIYISGDADYIVEDSYIPLERGDVVIILPHEVHVPVIRSKGVYERFYMLIPIDAFDKFEINPLEKYYSMEGHKISLSEKNKNEFLRLLYQISTLSDDKDIQKVRLMTAGLLLQAQGVLSTVKHRTSKTDEVEISSDIPENLREILKYIGLYAQEIPSVESIAKHFYISPQYLSTMFKKYVGVNANQYLRIKKIALAKSFLEKGSTVAEACYECGFSDSSHFIKNFKQYVGMTPKQYKNVFLKKKL